MLSKNGGYFKISRFKSKRFYLLIVLPVLILLLLVLYIDFSNIHHKTLIILILSIILWSTQVIPTGISALLVIALQLIFGLAEEFSEAIEGFFLTTIYFILVVSMISKAMTKVKLDKFLSRLFLHLSKGNIWNIIIGLFLTVMLLPIIMPSGNARLRMFVPLLEEVNNRFNLPVNSSFIRFTTWSLGGLNQVATLIVYTGGGLSILALNFLEEMSRPLNWVEWFLIMAPPIWIICFITALFMFFYMKVYQLDFNALKENNHEQKKYDNETKQEKYSFIIVVVCLIFMLLFWITGPLMNIPTIVPPLICIAIFSLPKLNLLNNSDLRNYDWENFLLIGSAISLALTIEKNGTAQIITDFIFSLVGGISYEGLNLLILFAVALFIRSMFVSPAAALTVIFPLGMAFASTVSLDPFNAFLAITILSASMLILPIQSPIMILAYQTGQVFIKEHVVISIVLLLSSIFVVYLSYWWYWPLYD